MIHLLRSIAPLGVHGVPYHCGQANVGVSEMGKGVWSVRMWEKNSKSVWFRDVVRAPVERKVVLGVRDEVAIERCWMLTKKKRDRLKCVHIREKIR